MAGTEYVMRHHNTMKVLAVWWAIKMVWSTMGEKKSYQEEWQEIVLGLRTSYSNKSHSKETKLYTIEDTDNKVIIVIDMACPNEIKK